MNFTALDQSLASFKRTVSRSFARNPSDLDDFMQEASIVVWKVAARDLPDTEASKLAKASIINRFRDMLRSGKRHRVAEPYGQDVYAAEVDDRIQALPSNDDVFEQVVINIAIQEAAKMLEDREVQVLLGFLQPSNEAVHFARLDATSSESRRDSGQLAMNIGLVEVRSKHIALALGISPATMSRSLQKVRIALTEAGFEPM